MKRFYLDKYPYYLEKIGRVTWEILIDPISNQEVTDIILGFGSKDNNVSIEGMSLKITDYNTQPSTTDNGELSLKIFCIEN